MVARGLAVADRAGRFNTVGGYWIGGGCRRQPAAAGLHGAKGGSGFPFLPRTVVLVRPVSGQLPRRPERIGVGAMSDLFLCILFFGCRHVVFYSGDWDSEAKDWTGLVDAPVRTPVARRRRTKGWSGHGRWLRFDFEHTCHGGRSLKVIIPLCGRLVASLAFAPRIVLHSSGQRAELQHRKINWQ